MCPQNKEKNLSSVPSTPLAIAWNFTYQCNLNCDHCYTRTEKGKELTFEEKNKVLEIFKNNKILQINFGGGEPLVNKDFFPIAEKAKKFNIAIALSTNGTLVTPPIAQKISSLQFEWINVSLDSATPEKHNKFRNTPNTFERATEAIKLLNKLKNNVRIVTVLSRLNFKEIDALIKLAEKLKVKEILFKMYKPSGRGFLNKDIYDLSPQEWKKTYQKIFKLQKKSKVNVATDHEPLFYSLWGIPKKGDDKIYIPGAPCGKISLCLKPNGDLTPCAYLNLKIGNILKDDLKKLWHRSPLLNKIRNRKPKGKCMSCKFFYWCRGGCYAVAYNLTKDINSRDPHCWV